MMYCLILFLTLDILLLIQANAFFTNEELSPKDGIINISTAELLSSRQSQQPSDFIAPRLLALTVTLRIHIVPRYIVD